MMYDPAMLDPITVSVLTHRFEAIVQEMGEAMLRTAYSQILNSSRDFSTAICDGQARLVAQAEHVPIHVGAIPWAVESVRDFFQGRIRPGDVFLLNDPYHGNNHLPDLPAFVPVFVDGNGSIIDITQASGMTLPQFSAFLSAQGGHLIKRNSYRQPGVWDADFRISKTFNLTRGVNLQVLAEVFNVFNHANYGSYATSLSATNAATTALFGQPQQIDGNAYVPREAQLGFRFGF